MTARQIFEATLIELSKVQAPALKLYEFNYLFNKAINQYINKVYNVYDLNQQTTDDLRVLKATAFLTPKKVNVTNSAIKNTGGYASVNKQGTETWTDSEGNAWERTITTADGKVTTVVKVKQSGASTQSEVSRTVTNASSYSGSATSYLSQAHSSIQSLHGATYEVEMPLDYLHMLNCVCIYYVAKTKDCWDAGSYIEVPALRLTADSWSQIVTDIYNRPSPMRPYYYIHNLNQQNTLPTNEHSAANLNGTDLGGFYKVTSNGTMDASTGVVTSPTGQNSNFSRTFNLGSNSYSVVEKPTASRVGNASTVRCEIRYGKDDTLFQLAEVQVDYVKVPQHIRLTQEQIDLTEDTSQIMEFPDYVNQEIINELVHLVMERTNDPRLSNNMQISQTIARPTGQQQQQTAAQG